MRLLNLGLALFFLVGCEQVALMNTPAKRPQLAQTKEAKQAKSYFLHTLHQGRYQDIPTAEYRLMAAYLTHPNDPQLAGYLGFAHIWQLAERSRTGINSPLAPNHIILSKKYFKDAVQLDPRNPIYLGFYGDTQLVEGTIFKDEREKVRGYFTLKKAIHLWPQFNYFTAGYPMSTLGADTKQFKEGLRWQWKTLDLCAGKKVNRKNPDFSPFMVRETTKGPQRACWNSVMAPHNFEGFFMNMGDMVMKTGDSQTAVILYRNARLSGTYSAWPYKTQLERRIVGALKNQPSDHLMFQSPYGCVACHQR